MSVVLATFNELSIVGEKMPQMFGNLALVPEVVVDDLTPVIEANGEGIAVMSPEGPFPVAENVMGTVDDREPAPTTRVSLVAFVLPQPESAVITDVLFFHDFPDTAIIVFLGVRRLAAKLTVNFLHNK